MSELKPVFVDPADQSQFHEQKATDQVKNLFTTIIKGAIQSSGGVQSIISFDVPNDDVAFAIEVTGFMSRSGVGGVKNSRYEKTVFFINRTAGSDVDLSEGVNFSFAESGPDTGLGSAVDPIALTIQRAGAEGSTASQEVEITADVNAAGTEAALVVELKIIGSHQTPGLSVNTNNITQ